MPQVDQPTDNTDIDIRYFFRQVGNAISALVWAVVDYFKVLLRNIGLFLGIIALFGLIALALYFLLPGSYRTEGLFISRSYPPDVAGTMINNLNDYVRKSENGKLVSSLMNTDPRVTNSIKGLTITSFAKDLKLNPRDSGTFLFAVQVRVSDTAIIDELQEGIIYYLANNEYTKKRRESRLRAVGELKLVYDSRINRLDSLEQLINRSVGTGNGTVVVADRFGAASAYQVEMQMQDKRLDLIEELETEKDIEVLQPMHKPGSYNYPPLGLIALAVVAAGLVISMILTPVLGRR